MPWLSIIMALITFFTQKKKDGGNTGRAAALAAVAGLGTYYVTHETEWGKENLGKFDGVVTIPDVSTSGASVPNNADGTPAQKNPDGTYTVTQSDGSTVTVRPVTGSVGGTQGVSGNGVTVPLKPGGSTGSQDNLWTVLKDWGPTGTATVVGTTAVVTNPKLKAALPWLLGGGLLILLLK